MILTGSAVRRVENCDALEAHRIDIVIERNVQWSDIHKTQGLEIWTGTANSPHEQIGGALDGRDATRQCNVLQSKEISEKMTGDVPNECHKGDCLDCMTKACFR